MARRVHFRLTPQSRPDRLAKQREIVQENKPWEKSTGPVTEAGKKRSSQNNRSHGLRSREHQQLQRALRDTEDSLLELGAELASADACDEVADE